MNAGRCFLRVVAVAMAGAAGCSAPKIDLSTLSRPARASELDAYNVFVGSWTWDAKVVNAEGANSQWRGTAKWEWTLDQSCLSGRISAESATAKFDSAGLWSWHPKAKKYVWTMFNNWGYPQFGSATYDAAAKKWRMDYKSVGLDGSESHGRYWMTVVDNDTLEWRLEEWMDGLHAIKKMEMTGTYRRQR